MSFDVCMYCIVISLCTYTCPERACPERACPERACPERACPERACPERACVHTIVSSLTQQNLPYINSE